VQDIELVHALEMIFAGVHLVMILKYRS